MTLQEELADDRRLVADAVRELARRTRFPVAFGGLIENGVARMTAFVGNHTDALAGLSVQPERGLGGRAMVELRPRMTGDYRTARQITHDYDVYILGEGIGTLLATPVIVSGRARGVLYGGAWSRSTVGGVAAAPAVRVAEDLGRELAKRDEARRRLAESAAPAGVDLSPRHREELRESYAELRAIATSIDDAAVRARIAEVERRLAALAGFSEAPRTEPIPEVRLSPREVDVLARAALGETNAQIGMLLGLREGTVKAYLSAAMAKLDASTRHAAVARARKWGLLP
ncbi:response regulator transcription factor [Microbacterium paludicola]|uniref:Response regulator transcription factor n=1 Tax=Microbacterium paludicola TaxID=300019 RepID=A0A4Y9FQH6_9MICO|nr:LuxR C-terminal-related transcriptional regulator [Microbacterium paludicola]MBF0817468.1 response regulator transcription factor [Microbacterium paludicola]TFU31112.1 response regulator transcription factor [Microbacterium paludicola]